MYDKAKQEYQKMRKYQSRLRMHIRNLEVELHVLRAKFEAQANALKIREDELEDLKYQFMEIGEMS